MSFQAPGSNTQSTGGFTFGAPNTTASTAQSTTAKAGGFTFGATGGGDAGSKFGFGAVAAVPTATTATSATTAPSNFGLGTAGPTVGFGAPTVTSSSTTTQPALPAFGIASTSTPQPAATGFGFGTTTATTSTASAVPTTITSTSSTPLTSGFSAFATSTVNTTANVTPTGAATTTVSSLLAAQPPPISAASAPATTGFASLTTATKTTDSSAMSTVVSQLSYNQLEEHINKWTLELEEQEKIFTDQATQINAWDKILISNNQKILDLNDAVQKVKSDQQTLEQELEFIATQHKELEESIMPLQKEFMKIPQVDVERSQTYLMVENLDTQLKQMSEDLKEIIDNLNESNRCQDNSDPIIQIGKILNAHMSSLQWIEQSTSSIGTKLEDITKMHETFKRDSERSFRSAYYN